MPISDNYKYNVGDRVKNGLTQEDGRVIDIKPLGEGALLVTVAIFVAGVAAGSKNFLQKVDQISGLEWTVVGTAAKEGASKLPLITNPMEGGQVSARATEIALSNEPTDRSISKLISDRLKAWNPKHADPNDELAFANAVFDRLQHLRHVKQAVFQRKGHLDLLMNYLTATGHKDAQGDWVGSYLVELVHNRKSAAASAIQQGDDIQKVLQRTGLPPDLKLRYKEFIPEGIETAWELLVHAKQRIRGMSYAEGNPLWNDYASILKRSVELSPHRRKMVATLQALDEAIDFTGETLSVLQSTAAFPQFGEHGGITEPEASARTEHQSEVRLFGKDRKSLKELFLKQEDPNRSMVLNQTVINPRTGERFPGVIVPRQSSRPVGRRKVSFVPESEKFDAKHVKGAIASERGRGIDRFSEHRDEQGPKLGSILEGPETVWSPDIGERTGRVRRPLTENQKVRADALKSMLPFEQNIDGRIIQYKGLPYRVTAVDPVTRRATLTPLHSDVDLLASDILTRPNAALKAVREAGRGRANLPLVGGIQKAAEADATRVAARIAARQTIRIKGGLLGTAAETVQVPLDLLREYLAGPATFKNADTLRRAGMPVYKDAQALRAAGFAGEADFSKKARSFSSRFEQRLRTQLGTHPRLVGATGRLAEDRLEELVHGARIAVFEHLGSIREGRHIQDLEAELLQVGVERAAHFAFDSEAGILAETFTGLDRLDDAGELVETGFDRVSRMTARARGVRPAAVARLSSERFITEEELRHQVLQFSGAVENLKVTARGVSSPLTDYASAFRDIFGDPVIGKPERALTAMERSNSVDLHQSRLLDLGATAEDIADAIKSGDVGSAKVRSQLKSFAAELGVHRTSLNREAREAWDLYQANLSNPNLGPHHPSTLAAARSFVEKKAAHIESVEERFIQRDLIRSRADVLGPVPISAANEQDVVRLYQAALELPVEQQSGALRALGIRSTLSGDEPVSVLAGRSGQQFILHQVTNRDPENPIPIGLAAVSQSDPTLARFLGGAREPFEVPLQELEESVAAGKASFVAGDEAKLLKRLQSAVDRSKTESVLHNYVGQAPTTLPLYRSGNTVAGFLGTDLVNAQSVIENAKEALAGKRALLFIDIETNREVNQITNFYLRRLEKLDGVWQEGAAVSLATPDLWNTPGVGGSEASRIATRFGHTAHIDEVVSSELEIANRAAAVFSQHQDALIVGHNIGFDVGKLAKVPGLEESVAATLADAARNRVTDTLLTTQLTHPNLRSYSLEELGSAIAGQTLKEAHLAPPDVGRTIEVFKQSAKRADIGLAALNSLEQTTLGADSVLFFHGGGRNLKGRAFKVAGLLDASEASEAFYKQTGKELGVGFGVALQPINFLTGEAEGAPQLNFARTPHGWARAFAAQGEVTNLSTARASMEATADDLARRRVRRLIGDQDAFTKILHERERLGLADAFAQGPEQFAAAQDELLTRLGQTTSALDRSILRGTHRYSESWMQDTRIVRQLQLERQFLEEEIGGTHAPVVNWLESSLRDATAADLPALKTTANQIWSDYMAQVAGLPGNAGDFAREAVVPKTSVSLEIPALGRKVQWSTTDANSLRSSIQRTITDVASVAQGSQPFNKALLGASESERSHILSLIQNRKDFLDADLGSTVEHHIFEHHISPALEKGLVQLAHDEQTGTELPLSIGAHSLEDAVQNILGRVSDITSRTQVTAENPLIPRSIASDALASIRDRLGVGGDLLSAAERYLDPDSLLVALHHNAPNSWTGKSFKSLLETAIGADALEQMQFTDRIKGIYKKMSTPDQELLGQVVKKTAPQWLDEITGKGLAAEITAAASPVRDFNPGTVVKAGLEVAEAVESNATALKGLGLIGLGVITAGVALLARRPQSSPGKTREQDDQENILHSTEKEVQKRKERVAKQTPLVNRITVDITANDPTGVSHDELIQSVHSSLGSFIGTEISRSANVHDRRSSVDRDYLDRVAAQLLQRPTVVR